MLDDVVADETHEKIKIWTDKIGETGSLEPALEQNSNDDELLFDSQNI